MAEPATLAAFLALVHRQVVRLGPREHLAVERLVRAHGEDWQQGELRAALASVLARNSEQWEQIARLYDELARSAAAARPERALSRFADALRKTPRWQWVAGLLLVFSLGVAVALALVETPPDEETKVEPPPPPPPEPKKLEQPSGDFLLIPVETTRKVYVPLVPPTPDVRELAVLTMISAILLAFGLRFARLGPAVRAQHRLQLEARKAATDEKRRRLEENKAAAGRPLEIRYRVDLHLPVSRQAMLDSAELLGRLYREEHGIDLDAEATLDRTVAAAGRFSPVLEPRYSRHEVLVLVDVEEGDHPWLGSFRRLLAAWAAQGIVFRCYEFHVTPDSLVESETREPVLIDELARRSEGLPLVIFSRQLDPHARRGAAAWVGQLTAWPRCGWLDPDPRRPEELAPARRRMIRRFEQLGLPRFFLSGEGVVLLARHLAGSLDGKRAILEPALPLLPARATAGQGGAVAEALRKWALAGALVPDPSWDQLEAIRRHFPEIHQVLGEPRWLQRLLEWVERETGERAEMGGGRALEIPEKLQHRWLCEQRELEQAVPRDQRFENRAHQLLLDQLGANQPEDELDAQWWRFKRKLHQAVLTPERAAELLAWVYESEVAHEAERVVEAELARHREGMGAGFSLVDIETLQAFAGRIHEGVPVKALLFDHRRLWARSALFAGCAALALLGALFVAIGPIAKRFAVDQERQSRMPAMYEPLEMVNLPGGDFPMGSERGDSDEVPVHQVKVAAFQISKTEVTVAQYRRCVDARVCEEPDTGRFCNWKQTDRDDHPINCVSWEDAQQYAKWVGARLPSEAEWEFAARSGGLAREYPWGDEPADCERAVISPKSFGTGCDEPGTWPVCFKTGGNTKQGLCDMAGNVWEWVEDDVHDDYRKAPADGSAWVDEPRASSRVIRGGSWRDEPRYARVANRLRAEPSWRDGDLGFRVAR